MEYTINITVKNPADFDPFDPVTNGEYRDSFCFAGCKIKLAGGEEHGGYLLVDRDPDIYLLQHAIIVALQQTVTGILYREEENDDIPEGDDVSAGGDQLGRGRDAACLHDVSADNGRGGRNPGEEEET